MLGLKIFVQVQTLGRRPFVPSHNFWHPANLTTNIVDAGISFQWYHDLFTKTKNIAIFFSIFKLQDFQLPMSYYALILSVFSYISPVQGWPPGNQSIISYLSLPRLNTIVKNTMEIVWSGFLCGIVLSLMVYLSMWLTPDGYVQTLIPHFL